jgi:hypothetical protein
MDLLLGSLGKSPLISLTIQQCAPFYFIHDLHQARELLFLKWNQQVLLSRAFGNNVGQKDT